MVIDDQDREALERAAEADAEAMRTLWHSLIVVALIIAVVVWFMVLISGWGV